MAVSHRSEHLIRQRLAALARPLPSARRGEAVAIHQARVATRRLREALPLVARRKVGRKLARRIRRLTRALGAVRELDVALMTLDELAAEAGSPSPGIARLHRIVREERQHLCAEMARQIEDVDVGKLRRKALAATRVARPNRGHAGRDATRIAAVRSRASRRGLTLQAAMDAAGTIYLPDRLHEVRIAVKKLRYSMELTKELTRSRAVVRIRTLKNAQDLLGRMHDLEVLIMRIRALQGSAQAPSLSESADLDRLVRRLETECRQLHVRYMGFKTALQEICNHVTAAEVAA